MDLAALTYVVRSRRGAPCDISDLIEVLTTMKKLLIFGALGAMTACGDGTPQRTVSNDPFCQQVIPTVEASWAAA